LYYFSLKLMKLALYVSSTFSKHQKYLTELDLGEA